MEIYIKNMVCPRCIRVVDEELTKNGIPFSHIELGKVQLVEDNPDLNKIAEILKENGFELLEEKAAQLVSEIKTFLIGYIRGAGLSEQKYKVSVLLEEKFRRDYSYLSHLFSQMENNTLEKFIITQKIELIKEWLVYNELSLSDMAYKLAYSSVAHLSSQFKQVTGFTPTEFKNLKNHLRRSIDEI
ncbi:MAG: helix-turn-helix transcriptional regulator [Bacteroidetes bacterium]|nr:helix-turn-helix transcriptional regulator [Bacteroidota bacterium]